MNIPLFSFLISFLFICVWGLLLVTVFSPLSGFLYSSVVDCSLLICFTLELPFQNLIMSDQVIKTVISPGRQKERFIVSVCLCSQ